MSNELFNTYAKFTAMEHSIILKLNPFTHQKVTDKHIAYLHSSSKCTELIKFYVGVNKLLRIQIFNVYGDQSWSTEMVLI